MELLLEDKGPIAPPPVLDQPFQSVADAVMSWPGVIAASHWHLYRRDEVDGVDFYVGDRELGHIHLDGQIHLATDRYFRDALVGSGRAETFPYGGSYDTWVLFRVRGEADIEHAIELFRLNYER